MGSTSGLPKSFRKRFEALESQTNSTTRGHQSLVAAMDKSAGKKSTLRKVLKLYHNYYKIHLIANVLIYLFLILCKSVRID